MKVNAANVGDPSGPPIGVSTDKYKSEKVEKASS
jgi:hypothetical protein